MLCLWALTDVPINDYSSLRPALEKFDVVGEIRDIVGRCISTDPKARQETAGVLANELTRVQARRAQTWIEKGCKHCRLHLTRTARDGVAAQVGAANDAAVQRFVEQDINDEATVDYAYARFGTPEQKLLSDSYNVHGSRMIYKIAKGDRDGDELVVIAVFPSDVDRIQKIKENCLTSPLTFDILPRPGAVKGGEALKILELALSEFEGRKQQARAQNAEEAIFGIWKNVLDAKATYEKERSALIRFSASTVEGRFVTLETDGSLDGVEIEQARLIETQGLWIPGTVYEIAGNTVVLHCPTGDLKNVPQSGRARLDTRAADIALERQRLALEAVRTGGTARVDLRTLLLNPATS